MARPRHEVRAGVIASLADVYCYQPSEPAFATSGGDVQPPKAQRKSFPRALKRLRDRLRVLEERLALDTNALRQDVMDRELQKTLLTKKLRGRDERAVAVVQEYFAVFQHGWLSRRHDGRRSSVSGLAVSEEARLAERQRQFLRVSVDSVVVEELASHWQKLSRGDETPRLTLESVECVGDADQRIVVAKGTLTAVEYASFDAMRAECCVRYPCRVVLVVTDSGIICRHDFETDRVMGLLQELGTLEHVARWLQAAPREANVNAIS